MCTHDSDLEANIKYVQATGRNKRQTTTVRRSIVQVRVASSGFFKFHRGQQEQVHQSSEDSINIGRRRCHHLLKFEEHPNTRRPIDAVIVGGEDF